MLELLFYSDNILFDSEYSITLNWSIILKTGIINTKDENKRFKNI